MRPPCTIRRGRFGPGELQFINDQVSGDGLFEPIRFSGWPELKETFLANDLEATFIHAPLAMSLREQGVPIKIVYLRHRDGTTMMVRKDGLIGLALDLMVRRLERFDEVSWGSTTR